MSQAVAHRLHASSEKSVMVEMLMFCGARRRCGEPCTRRPVRGSLRCHRHGGRAGRPRGIPQHPNTRAAAGEGHRRWLERMRLAKAAGLIDKIPGGRRAKGLPPLSKDRKIRRAQRIIEARMEERKKEVAATVTRAWEELSSAEKLSLATDQSLDKVYAFLLLDFDPVEDQKLVLAQQQVALATISNQIKLDSARLQAETALGGLDDGELGRRLGRLLERVETFEAEAAAADDVSELVENAEAER